MDIKISLCSGLHSETKDCSIMFVQSELFANLRSFHLQLVL